MLDKFPDEQAGKVIKAIAHFRLNGTWPASDSVTDGMLSMLRPDIEKQVEKYRELLARNRSNGTRSAGRPKAEINKPTDNPQITHSIPTGLQEPADNQQKQKKSSATSKKVKAAPETPAEDPKLPIWQPAVDTWYAFYKAKHDGIEPAFKGVHRDSLKSLLENLDRRVRASKPTADIVWTPENTKEWLTKFLEKAWADEWIRSKFLLHIINQQFDAIANRKPGQQQRTSNSGAGHGAGIIAPDRDYTNVKL